MSRRRLPAHRQRRYNDARPHLAPPVGSRVSSLTAETLIRRGGGTRAFSARPCRACLTAAALLLSAAPASAVDIAPGAGWSGDTAQPATIGEDTAVSSVDTTLDVVTVADDLSALPTVFAVKIESPKTFTVTPTDDDGLYGYTKATDTEPAVFVPGRVMTIRVRSDAYDYAFAEVSYTILDGDTAEDIVDGLVAAWNGHADPRVNTHTAVDAGTSLTVSTGDEVFAGYIQPWPPSEYADRDNLRLTIAEDPPAPLSVRRRYWARKSSSTTVKLYASESNANDQVNPIDLTDVGAGTSAHRLMQYGLDCKPFGRWNCVPYQVFDGTLNVGVVADHQAGVDRVEFAVDGGAWVSVDTPAVNATTGSTEYFVTLDAADFAPGGDTAKVRAVIYPEVGIPRVLDGDVEDHAYGGPYWQGEWELELYPNKTETTVELAAGTYNWGQGVLGGTQAADSTWLVVKPAVGVAVEDVIIQDGGSVDPGFGLKRVRLEGVTSHIPVARSFEGDDRHLWRDGGDVTDPLGRYNAAGAEESAPNYWQTDTTVHDVRIGTGRGYVRGGRFDDIGEDCCRSLDMIVDCVIDDVNRGTTSWHPSPIPNPLGHDNRIYENLTIDNVPGSCWAMYQGNNTDFRNTDVLIRGGSTTKTSTGNVMFTIGGLVHNFCVKDHAFTGGGIKYRNDEVAGFWTTAADNLLFDEITGATPDSLAGATLSLGVVGENLSEWTEVDPNTKFEVEGGQWATGTAFDAGINRNESCYVYKDFGAGHFSGVFTHYVKGRFVSSADASLYYPWMLSNAPGTQTSLTDFVGFRVTLVSGLAQPQLIEQAGGVLGTPTNTGTTVPESVDHYYEIDYDPDSGTHGTLHLRCYSDAERTVLVTSASRALAAAPNWRYAQTAVSQGNAGLSNRVAQGTWSELDLTMGERDPLLISVGPEADPDPATVGEAVSLNVEAVGGVEPYSYAWALTDAPVGGTADFDDDTSRTPSITPDAAGDYTAEVTITDADGDTVTDSVTFTADAPDPAPGGGNDGPGVDGSQIIILSRRGRPVLPDAYIGRRHAGVIHSLPYLLAP